MLMLFEVFGFAFFQLTDAGFCVRIGRIDHEGDIVQFGNMQDGAFIEFESVLFIGILPFIRIHSELERAFGYVAPAYKFKHIVSGRGIGNFELETQSDLVHGKFEGVAAGTSKDIVNVVVEAHDDIAHVRSFKCPAVNLLLEPSSDGVAPLVEFCCITGDGASLRCCPQFAFAAAYLWIAGLTHCFRHFYRCLLGLIWLSPFR